MSQLHSYRLDFIEHFISEFRENHEKNLADLINIWKVEYTLLCEKRYDPEKADEKDESVELLRKIRRVYDYIHKVTYVSDIQVSKLFLLIFLGTQDI